MAKKKTSKEKPLGGNSHRDYPLLISRDTVALPGLMVPLYVNAGPSANSVSFALENSSFLILLLQSGAPDEPPSIKNVSSMGTYARIIQCVQLSNGDMKIRVHVQGRAQVVAFKGFSPMMFGTVELLNEQSLVKLSPKHEQLLKEMKGRFAALGEFEPGVSDLVATAQEIFDPGELADLIATTISLSAENVQSVLEELDGLKRLARVQELLSAEFDRASLRAGISQRADREIGRLQREEILREHLRQIQAELGEEYDSDEEVGKLGELLRKKKMPAAVKRSAEKQLRRLRQLHPDTSEAALARTYLDWMLDVPWSFRTKDRLDLERAKKILDEDHYGLEKTKERVLDFLGVQKLRRGAKGPILLLVGPPGVGKTSLGRSIARAMGRKFYRLSLGGLRDEAELRGHRRTYVGALPGRIIQGLKSAGTKNPVFMLDELDKVGTDFRGDPASVLLEILDPEQNKAFEDHYLNVPYDLSEVMFIGTANITDTIPRPLLDRMEVVELPGYTLEEKVQISQRYIIPREKEENGLGSIPIKVPDSLIEFIVNGYTRESGVRELGRRVSTVFRKVARAVVEGTKAPKTLTEAFVEQSLGPIRFLPEKIQKEDDIGVATGLAWTEVGGETLTIEVTVTHGKGDLSLTGQMGEVMQESAKAALTYVQSRAEQLGISPDFYESSGVHVHIPEGAIPKDGPSAGVAIVTSLVSVLTNRKVASDLAMTGEITLRGNVLPIGGLREKALAALRVGIKRVIIPKENARELVEFPKYLLEQIKFIPVETLDEVLDAALRPVAQTKRKSSSKKKSKNSALKHRTMR